MINPEDRLYAGSGQIFPKGPYTWYCTDLDQRRVFAVTYGPPTPVEDASTTDVVCIKKLQQHVDDLGEGVYAIRFSDPNGPITISTDLADDMTEITNCHQFAALELPFPVKVTTRDRLVELDRLDRQVDLVTYNSTPSVAAAPTVTKAAFKYWYMEHGMFRRWYELNSWSRLPRDHPHIVPFDAVVLDKAHGGIVGFTSLFIPGGTLDDNNATTRPFQLRWLRQLLSVVDDLNHVYGVMHQDIAPRNLLIDESDNLRIFDFNYAIQIDKDYVEERDDMKGVIFTLYEIITLDEHYREVPHKEQDADAVMRLEWTKHPDVKLDAEVGAFRKVLKAWVQKRKGREFKHVDTWVRWTRMPEMPLAKVFCGTNEEGKPNIRVTRTTAVLRRHLQEMGEPFSDWERPASYHLRDTLAKVEAGKAGGDSKAD